MSFFTYLARCSDNTLYTGYCKNIQQREEMHNAGSGARYTRSRRPVKILYFEEYKTKPEAMKREYEIKQLSRPQKEALIASS